MLFRKIFPLNVKSVLFAIGLLLKLLDSCKSTCFETIQNGDKNRVLQVWTEICHEIFDGWKVQTDWYFQRNLWCVRSRMFLPRPFFKGVRHGFATTRLSQKQSTERKYTDSSGMKNVFGTAVSEAGKDSPTADF